MIKVGYAIEEAAEALGVGRTTMYELVRRGEIESVKIGRRHIIPVAAIEAYMDSLRAQPR